jgi:hypothetical protein
MADQAAVTNSNGFRPAGEKPGGDASATPSGTGTVVSNVAGFGEDLLNLAELQARLAALELRQNIDAVKTGVSLIATAILVAAAALPVGLIGIAELLVSEMGLKRGSALLTTSIIAILVAGVLIGLAVSILRRNQIGFPLSREELARNVNWVRTVLRQSGRLSFRR